MNGRLLRDSLCGKAAVINGCFNLILGKHLVCEICPVCSPDTELFITIPLLGNGILSAVPGTFWVFVNTFIALFLSSRWSKIEFFLSYFIAVLLFPALFLCTLKFRSGKSFFCPIFDTEIFFFSFILPCSIFIQWSDSKKNMSMGIVTISIMNTEIGTHSHIYKVFLNKVLEKRNITVLV